jgi:carbonic anhydrase/acetyltransferase-like protein (isoleucine patch superfamily)
MRSIIPLNGHTPSFGEGTWVAHDANVIGEVRCGRDCSIWFQATLRGDVGHIHIGDATNVQDGAIIHATTGKSATLIGNRVTIGHRAIVHGCTVEDDVLIGMGSIVLDNAHVERGAVIAAGAVVLENTRVPAGTTWAGVPARQVKAADPDAMAAAIRQSAESYVKYKDWYL